MGSRVLRHGHRGSLEDNGRTGRRRFSANVIFLTTISYESQKCQVAKVTPQTPTLWLDSLWIWCESGLKKAWKGQQGRKWQKKGRIYFRAFCVNYLLLSFIFPTEQKCIHWIDWLDSFLCLLLMTTHSERLLDTSKKESALKNTRYRFPLNNIKRTR